MTQILETRGQRLVDMEPNEFLIRAMEYFKKLSNFSTLEKKSLEENLLHVKGIVISFDTLQPLVSQNQSIWTEMDKKYKTLLKKLETFVELWQEYENFLRNFETFLEKLIRHNSIGSSKQANRTLNRDSLRRSRILLAILKSKSEKLTEFFPNPNFTSDYSTMEKKICEIFDIEKINTSSQSLCEKSECSSKIDLFSTNLDVKIEMLKNLQHSKYDLNDIQNQVNTIEILKQDREKLELEYQSMVNDQIDDYHDLKVFDISKLKYQRFVADLNERDKMLLSQQRNHVNLKIDLEKLINDLENFGDLRQFQNVEADVTRFDEKFSSLQNLRNSYSERIFDKLRLVDYLWTKMRKNGAVSLSMDKDLDKVRERAYSVGSQLQNLDHKYHTLRQSMARIREEIDNVRRSLDSLKSLDLSKIDICDLDTISDLQAKISKIDQKLTNGTTQKFIDDAQKLIDATFSDQNVKSKKIFEKDLKVYSRELLKFRSNLEEKREILSRNLMAAEHCMILQKNLKRKLSDVEKTTPNIVILKTSTNLESKICVLQEFKIYEKSLKSMNLEYIEPLQKILKHLELTAYRKPLKELFTRWQDMIHSCWESIMKLTQSVMQEQSKNNLRLEIIEWIDSTKQIVEESTNEIRVDCLEDLKRLHENSKDLLEILKQKRKEIIIEFEADERSSMEKMLVNLQAMLKNYSEKLHSIIILWSDFDVRLEYQKRFSNQCDKTLNEIKNFDCLNNREIAFQDLKSSMKTKTPELKNLQEEAQAICEMIGSFDLVQILFSIVSSRNDMIDLIEIEIKTINRFQFIKSQIVSLRNRIGVTINKLKSINVMMISSFMELDDRENVLKLIFSVRCWNPILNVSIDTTTSRFHREQPLTFLISTVEEDSKVFEPELCKFYTTNEDSPQELIVEYDKTKVLLTDLNDRIHFLKLWLLETRLKLESYIENSSKPESKSLSISEQNLPSSILNRKFSGIKLDKYGKIRKHSSRLSKNFYRRSFSISKSAKIAVNDEDRRVDVGFLEPESDLTMNVEHSANSSKFGVVVGVVVCSLVLGMGIMILKRRMILK